MNIIPLPEDRTQELFSLYDSYDRPSHLHPKEQKAREILTRIRAQDGEVIVAVTDNDRVAGTYAIYICQSMNRNGLPFAVVENVICGPEFRRQGIGKRLMDHAIAYAKGKGCYKVFLQTGAKRGENHAFYEACGFENTKRGYQVRFD